MSLREDIWEQLPEIVTNVIVDRSEVRGAPAVKVSVYFRSPDDKPMYMVLHFSQKNQMAADHIATVVRSYLRNGIASRNES